MVEGLEDEGDWGVPMRLREVLGDRRVKPIADEAGVDHSNVSRILNGHTATLSANYARRLGRVLGVRPEWLLFGTGPKRATEEDEELVRLRGRVADLERALLEVERHVGAAVGAALGRR